MSFQTKLLLVFIAFSILASSLMLVFMMQSQRLLLQETRENRRSIAKITQISAQHLAAALDNEPEKIQQLITNLRSHEGIQEVTVVDKDQHVIASTNPNLIGQSHPVTSMEPVIDEKEEEVESPDPSNLFEVSVPLIREKRIVGLVRSTVLLKDIRYPLELLFSKNMLITVAVLLLGLGSSFLILQRLNKPLKQLIQTAGKVAAGDLSAHIPVAGRDEIGRLNRTFNLMTQQLAEQKMLESKLHLLERRSIVAEIASYLAHEIRNPLNLIMLTAHHLGTQFTPPEPDRRKKHEELVMSLKSEVEHLNNIIGGFLSIGRQSQLKKSRFLLSDVIGQIQVMAKQQLVTKNINLQVEETCRTELTADKEQMRLVFLNILLNAIEAVPPGGSIRVQAEPETGPLPGITISVIDNGPGIRPDHLEQVFEPYFTQKAGGTGLGLSLVKRIVEEHDGTIRAENGPSGGAAFRIRLPGQEQKA